MKLICALAISYGTLLAQTDPLAIRSVTAARAWSFPDVTRVAVEVSGSFQFRTDRLESPDRVYFDILNSRPRIDSKRFYSKTLDDKLVKRVRVAETNPGVTRVVLDLADSVEITTSQLSNPNRLIVEVRSKAAITPTETAKGEPIALPPAPATPPVKHEVALVQAPKLTPPAPPDSSNQAPQPFVSAPAKASERLDLAATEAPAATIIKTTAKPAATDSAGRREAAPPKDAAAPLTRQELAKLPAARPESVPQVPVPSAVELGTAAKHTSSGQSSLTRALGLKIGRVVIDPGHGGHDQGTQGPKGLVEKELVLDVAQRVGKLIEDRLGAEVIYTRTDDTFIPLEGRTALANEKKADLFLSIHANSSPYPRISGVETFYLNFTDSKDALDVASRENASSQKSVFELQDIIQKITMHEKLDESKDFAGRIQASLYSLSSHNVPGQKNRGVKKAPFVVLIGARMPSVLAEIGFVSNPREESLLKKPDYRQKVAEALYRGLSRYAESLSHFQMARNESADAHK